MYELVSCLAVVHTCASAVKLSVWVIFRKFRNTVRMRSTTTYSRAYTQEMKDRRK